MEHRCGLRRPVSLAVHLWTRGGVASHGELQNVSLSGALVRTALPVRLLARVTFQFKTSRAVKVKMTAEAQVVRVTNTGFAVEWCEFAPSSIELLMRSAWGTETDQPHGASRSDEARHS